MFPIRTKGFTVSSTTPDAREGSHKVQIIGGLLVIVFTFALVGVMILLEGRVGQVRHQEGHGTGLAQGQ